MRARLVFLALLICGICALAFAGLKTSGVQVSPIRDEHVTVVPDFADTTLKLRVFAFPANATLMFVQWKEGAGGTWAPEYGGLSDTAWVDTTASGLLTKWIDTAEADSDSVFVRVMLRDSRDMLSGWIEPDPIVINTETPVIYQCYGSAMADSTFAIGGGNFGTAPTVQFFDDFEAGADGDTICSVAPVVGAWLRNAGNTSGGYPPKYSSAYSVSGDQAFMGQSQMGVVTNGAYVGAWATLDPDSVREIYVSSWQMIPLEDAYPGEGNPDGYNWKTIWLAGPGNSVTTHHDLIVPMNNITNAQLSGNDWHLLGAGAINSGRYYTGWTMPKGLWRRFDVYSYDNDNAYGDYNGHAWSRIYDGSTTTVNINRPNIDWRCVATDTLEWQAEGFCVARINGMARPSLPNPARQFFDDVYIASGPNCRARVELGNNAAYSTCTVMHVQTFSAWNEGGISLRLNTGNAAAGSIWYLYVVAADGSTTSNGVPIEIGATIRKRVNEGGYDIVPAEE